MTTTPATGYDPATRIHYTPPTADRVIDGPDQYVALNLEPVAAPMLRDLLHTIANHPLARAAWHELTNTAGCDLLDRDAVALMGQVVRALSRDGALTITLCQAQADTLAQDLTDAAEDAATCWCGNRIAGQFNPRCDACEDGRR